MSEQTNAMYLAAAIVDHRRHDIPQFRQRPCQRIQMVHRHLEPTADQLQQAFTNILDDTISIVLVK